MICRLVRVRDIFFNTMKRLETRRSLQALPFTGDKILAQRMFLFNFCWLYTGLCQQQNWCYSSSHPNKNNNGTETYLSSVFVRLLVSICWFTVLFALYSQCDYMQGVRFVPADLPSSNLAYRLCLKCQEKQDTTYHRLRRRRRRPPHHHHHHHEQLQQKQKLKYFSALNHVLWQIKAPLSQQLQQYSNKIRGILRLDNPLCCHIIIMKISSQHN